MKMTDRSVVRSMWYYKGRGKGVDEKQAKEHFEKLISGTSYMTPEVMEYGWLYPGKISYELSKGKGMEDEELFGVTSSRFSLSLSMVWFTEEQARVYIRFVRARIGGLRADKAKRK